MNKDLEKKNKRIGLIVLAVTCIMIGMSFAAVPLYSLFCQVTGYGGTTQTADSLPDTVLADRTITIRFNTDIAPDLPWDFKAERHSIKVNPGQKGLISYHAKNHADVPVAGAAIYNVTPLKAGPYFHKIQCFCFEEQILQPDQETAMPVMFYVDPSIADDPALNEVKTITLSYTFFKTDTDALEQALEDFYNQAPAQPDDLSDDAGEI